MSSRNGKSQKMPALFIGHGSPMNALEENDYTTALQKLSGSLPTPKAILVISAHWETKGTWITAMPKPKTIHDFYGFPKPLYEIQYPSPGDPQLAQDISEQIKVPTINLDKENWGLDHGTWAVLKHLFPKANVPVLQLSLDMTKPMEYHFELGQKIKALREQGVMILGSGNIVHNLRAIDWNTNAPAHDWAADFDQWVKDKLEQRDFLSLVKDPLSSKAGQLSIPTVEHYLPLLYVLGASDTKEQLSFDFEGIQNASMSMRCLRFS